MANFVHGVTDAAVLKLDNPISWLKAETIALANSEICFNFKIIIYVTMAIFNSCTKVEDTIKKSIFLDGCSLTIMYNLEP